jgi:tetratricopeptide (TPR) repeat protein
VLQLISIGNAVVAERYTYVPYIGIFFLIGMEAYKAMEHKGSRLKWMVAIVAGIWIAALAFLTWQRIPVWKSSQTLWTDVLRQYPESPRAWVNKGLDLYDQKKWPAVIDHLTSALILDPHHSDALEWRTKAYLENKEYEKALQDAVLFQKAYPHKEEALFLLARTQDATGAAEESIVTYTQLIASYPTKSEYINNRGVVYFNRLRKFDEAKADFEHAIQLNPNSGSFYLNLSRCYYMANDIAGARKHAARGVELGAEIDPSYARLVGL